MKLSPRFCSCFSMLLLPAFPIATTQMNAPTPTAIPRIVRMLLIALRLSAAVASRTMFAKFIAARSNVIRPAFQCLGGSTSLKDYRTPDSHVELRLDHEQPGSYKNGVAYLTRL